MYIYLRIWRILHELMYCLLICIMSRREKNVIMYVVRIHFLIRLKLYNLRLLSFMSKLCQWYSNIKLISFPWEFSNKSFINMLNWKYALIIRIDRKTFPRICARDAFACELCLEILQIFIEERWLPSAIHWMESKHGIEANLVVGSSIHIIKWVSVCLLEEILRQR